MKWIGTKQKIITHHYMALVQVTIIYCQVTAFRMTAINTLYLKIGVSSSEQIFRQKVGFFYLDWIKNR